MRLLFSQERGCLFPEHLLDPEIGKKSSGQPGSFQMLPSPGSHSSSSLIHPGMGVWHGKEEHSSVAVGQPMQR